MKIDEVILSRQEERLWKTVAAWQANNAGHQAISPNSLCYVKKNDRKSSLDLCVECRSHRLTGVILSSSSCIVTGLKFTFNLAF
jgi:hypothetical protein